MFICTTNKIDVDRVLIELEFLSDANGVTTNLRLIVRNSVHAALVTFFCCSICHVCMLAQEGRRHKFNHRESVSNRI